VDSKEALEYDAIVSSLKLLGSRFLNEIQSDSKNVSRSKTYVVNAVLEDDQPAFVTEEEHAYVGDSWDDGKTLYDDTDPDAVLCMQSEEDSILEALQGDMELAACYNTYVDARKRLSDRNKNRGFWQAAKGSNAGSKGKGKSKVRQVPQVQRILLLLEQ